MACYSPLHAFRKEGGGITFDRGASFSGTPMKLPCGQCIGCRIDRAADWATRCMNEKRMHYNADSAFVTLTYGPDFLPSDGGLVKRDLQLFMKRVRNLHGPGVRFYGVGEYGGQFGRPHYHVLLFNHGFTSDARLYARGKRAGDDLYTSKVLSGLWSVDGHSIGLATFGNVTYDSCAYVAGYVIDKITGKPADDWYMGRQPEFALMSKGIGASYYMKYAHEIYATDSLIVNGKRRSPPRYYDEKWKLLDSMGLDEIKSRRRRVARRFKFHVDNSPDRRRVREVVQLKKLLMKKGQV